MRKKYRVLILGEGRIARAAAHYLQGPHIQTNIGFPVREERVKRCDLLIGALAGEFGEKCLKLALKYRKNLIDISDVDPPFYLAHKKEINRSDILVIPGCGFSPGLVNLILGKEISFLKNIREVEVKAGSLSFKKSFFPFLWCFEDLVLEHQIPSWQVIAGKQRKFPPFYGCQEESFFGIPSESYYCASGFENLLKKAKVSNFKCRVVRPKGFMSFFSFLRNYGFLKKENLSSTKKILEGCKIDNLTLGEVTVTLKDKQITWLVKSFSRAQDELNSMQKITTALPVALAKMTLGGKFCRRGLLFMEDIGSDASISGNLLRETKKLGVYLQRRAE